jgi:hypothetical protein
MNIKAMLQAIDDERRAIRRALYGDGFWKPILQRWLIWAGCSWAVLTAMFLCPKLLKAFVKAMGM